MANVSTSVPTGPPASNGIVSSPKASRLSFASVAALAASQQQEPPKGLSKTENSRPVADGSLMDNFELARQAPHGDTEALRESVARLNIMDKPGPIIASADTDVDGQAPISDRIRHDDEKTHLSFISNPTVSTDVRSVVSGTTFAMDEKESIRPDESASVKAADEDDSTSGGTSGGPQSLAGSEAGKAFRDQFHEISGAKKALPLTASLVQQMPDESGRTASSAAAVAMAFAFPIPDEKLLDALQSQRDRMFLLQLEQQLVGFVNNPKEQILHLPPNNAFCRLLAHRLADYYNLSHSAEPNNVVRIGKTDSTRLPPTLTEAAGQQIPSRPVVQPPPALKIMRRSDKKAHGNVREPAVDQPDLVPASPDALDEQFDADVSHEMSSSKETSPGKDMKRPTFEEREAIYNARREQLYRDVPEKKSADNSTAASRASSTLGGLKPKKKMPKNDDFEPRSAYTNMNYPNGQQQGYTYPTRPTAQMYGYPQDGTAMYQESHPNMYPQMEAVQQGYMQDPNKASYNVYGQTMLKQVPFNANYGYNMHQQMGSGPRYTHPMHGNQPMQSYSMSPYEPVYMGFTQMQGHPQMMQPNVATYPVPQGYVQQPLKQQVQFGAQMQAPYPYHMQPMPQGISPVPAGSTMYMPTHDGNPNAYNNANYQMYGHGAGAQGFGGVGNNGMQTQALPYSGGPSNSSRPLTPSSGYQASLSGNSVSWHMLSKGQGRENSRSDEYVVPRQGGEYAGQNYASSQLNKYDKSSLPPKPPAPTSSGS